MTDFEIARRNMIDCQVRTNRVTDPRLLTALATIPRERFVETRLKGVAYIDEDISIGNGRYLLEPMVGARLLQILEVEPDDVVLDIGCGTGYTSAVIASLASTVVAVESDTELAQRASELLSELSIDNAVVIEDPLEDGYPKQAPYDAILFGGRICEVPDVIMDQLAEGGRLVAVIGDGRGAGEVTMFVKSGGAVSRRPVFDANVPALPGFEAEAGFVF